LKKPRDNTKAFISLGFTAVLALLFVIVLIALDQMSRLNAKISSLVEETNVKTAAANTMRDAIRLRANSLKTMRLNSDPFIRDEEYFHFLGYADSYIQARENLLNTSVNEAEIKLLNQLDDLARWAQPLNERAADLLVEEASDNDINIAMKAAADSQNLILDVLDQLVILEDANAANSIKNYNALYLKTRNDILTLAGLAFIASALIAFFVIRNITEKNRHISWQASHDELTGLYNRREFKRQLDFLIRNLSPDHDEHALFYMDLDKFKIINDICGHPAGDEFLRQLAKIMKQKLRKADVLARLGGDEFGMLLIDCPLDVATEVGETLRAAVENFTFNWEGKEFTAGISIGIVAIKSTDTDSTSLLRAADTACYLAKKAGRNRVHQVSTDGKEINRLHNEINIISQIKEALERNLFQLAYQPIVPAHNKSGLTHHAEILLRMTTADGNVLKPEFFLPAAERYHLMPAIDRWVLFQILAWMDATQFTSELPSVIINLSGQSLADEAFLATVVERLANTTLDTSKICFEITETAAIENITLAIEFMTSLRKLGCCFALDDFGSGLSSFTYLKHLPIDYVKIDGAFIREIASDPVSRAMVSSINEIGHVMGKQTIAEFVENAAILEQVKELEIDYAQGNYTGREKPLTRGLPGSMPQD